MADDCSVRGEKGLTTEDMMRKIETESGLT
jgi:hypothetical protein